MQFEVGVASFHPFRPSILRVLARNLVHVQPNPFHLLWVQYSVLKYKYDSYYNFSSLHVAQYFCPVFCTFVFLSAFV